MGAATVQPPGYNAEAFSPGPSYREIDADALVDGVSGPEEIVRIVYPFNGARGFVEYNPYDP